jgi:hypothetical protein
VFGVARVSAWRDEDARQLSLDARKDALTERDQGNRDADWPSSAPRTGNVVPTTGRSSHGLPSRSVSALPLLPLAERSPQGRAPHPEPDHIPHRHLFLSELDGVVFEEACAEADRVAREPDEARFPREHGHHGDGTKEAA